MPIMRPYLLETDSKLSALSDETLKLFTEILKRTNWNK